MKKKIILLTITILLCISNAWSLPYKISYLTADNGLSRNMVDYIYRDSRGFMWICTNKGLDRYDGYEFVHFDSRSQTNPLLSDNVHCVTEDANGDMWIGTENGLFFLNYKTGEILNAAQKLNNHQKLATQQIIFITKDEQGSLWIGTESGLSKISFEDETVNSEDIYQASSPTTSILFYNGNILIARDTQIFRLIKNNDGKYQQVNTDNKLRQLAGIVNSMFYDNGLIWIGTSNGLYKYEQPSETLTRYTANAAIPNQLTSSYVTDIKKSKEGQLLIGTLIGLNIYNYLTDSFTGITSESREGGYALNNNFTSCLLAEDNTIWVGTEKGGVNILSPNQNFFGHIGNFPANPVNAIFEDNDGDLFVGIVEGGLHIRKKGSADFISSYAQIGNPKTLSHNSASCIAQDFNGDYWIGTWGLGINKLKYKDKYKPVFEQYISNQSKNNILSNFVAALAPDNINKGLWIGTREGIDFLDINTGKFKHILNYLPQEKKIRFVTGMYIDSRRRLWIGTNYGLICIFLNESNLTKNRIRYKHYQYLLANSSSGIYEKINCIVETKNKQLWFGSNGNGIYTLDEKSDTFKFINIDEGDGLLDNVVYGMLEDETGTLWLSTDKGLCAYNYSRNSIRNYTKSDGLKSNQFYWDAYFKGHDGKMYFGSVAGVTAFDPLKTTPAGAKNSTTITRIRIINDDVYPAKIKIPNNMLEFEGSKLVGVRLHESDKAFSVEFSALSYSQADKIKYAYRLKGFDSNWTEVNADRRFANFTNIKKGDYKLEVKCTNPDGTWSDIVTTIDIEVIPPFYKTWWFLILLFGAIAYGIYRYSLYRITLLKRQETHLRKLVEQRTHEIELQKEQLSEQATQLQSNVQMLMEHQDEVSRQNEMLITKNQEITRQKEELEELTQKLEEATVDKIGFFTNITHEFRTPITLILGPVERSLKLSTNPKVLEQLNIVRRNSKLLLSLINQLMDFRKMESGKMEVTKTQQNFVEFLDDIILPFEDLVKDRGISFRKQYRINPPEFLFDRDNMQKVLGNLLSNAIKFTPDRGEIAVVASTYVDKSDHKEKLYVAVKDTGKGIPKEDLEKIFERFYQSKSNVAYSGSGQSGTGIGLYLCKQIVELHNGTIEALNQHTGGSCFRFIIPIERRISTVVSLDGKQMEMMVASESVVDEDPISEEISKNKPVLLIVEDNTDMRQYIRSILCDDYNVLEAPNGVVGLEITNRYQPDLIISDIMMPEMDGMEMCKKIKTNFVTSHIPIVLLTAKSSTDTQIESFHLGADAFLVKPFDEDLLKAMIHNLSEKKKRIQMNFAENMDAELLHFDDESLDKKFMDKALKILKENYTNPDFDVTEFIDAMGISRSLLHKKLTNLAGQSASRFIRIYRLNIARELLIMNRASHSLNISEIAYEVGFNDPKYFTRCFTKHFGTQPSTFMDEK